jgi:hypothetical protein
MLVQVKSVRYHDALQWAANIIASSSSNWAASALISTHTITHPFSINLNPHSSKYPQERTESLNFSTVSMLELTGRLDINDTIGDWLDRLINH